MTVAERLSKAVSKVVRDVWTATRSAAQRRTTARSPRIIPVPGYLVDVLEPRQLFSAALDLIGVTALRNDPAFAGIDGSGGTVVVIDTGVDFSHSKLSASKIAEADFAYGNGSGSQRITDEHGTHVAGIIGARDSNIGVATGVGLIGINVFTETFGGDVGASETDIEQALAWVLENRERYNIVAVNMSLGSGNYSSESAARSSIVYDDVKRLESAGVTVVTAAGNSYAELRRSGSASPGVFSTLVVGAVYEENEGRVGGGGGTDYTTAADRLTYFSQRPTTDNEIFAPGAFITSTVPGGGTKDLAGTSMASPMVAGVVALMQEAALQFGGRRLSPAEVRTIMQQTGDVVVDGDDEDTSVPTTGNSYLRVNAYNAVKYIRDQFAGGVTPTGNTDPNGTLAGAVAGPTLGLDNTSPDPLAGTIGADGTTDVAADVDLYRFVVAAPGDVTITVDPTTAFQSVIRLFNTTGTSLGTFTASGGGDHDVTVQLAAGTYYVGVSGAPNVSYNPTVAGSGVEGGTGDYELFFDLDTDDADGVLSGATPINLSPGDVPQALESSVGFDGDTQVGGADVDFYRVVVPDDGSLLVDIDTPDESNYADTYIRVFDENGNELANSDDDLATGLNGDFVEFREGGFGNTRVVDAQGSFQGHRTDSFVGGTVSRGDVYYIAVANYNNRNFQPNSFAGRVSTGSTGSYSLFVGFRNNDVNGAIPQAVQTATLPVEFAPGVIGTDNTTVDVGDRDVDVIRLRPTADGILEIDVDSYDDSSITDPVDAVLRLFDSSGTLLASNDNVGSSLDPLLRFQVQGNTDYYVAVSGYGNDTFDPFLLGSGGSGDTGEYNFSARLLDLSSSAGLTNDTITDGGVTNLSVGQAVTASVGDDSGFARGATDVDLYRFVAPFSGQFIFAVEPSDAFGVDPYLRVFDNAGAELAADDNSGTTTNGNTGGARIVVELAAGQSYFVGVNGAGPSARAYNPVTGAGVAAGDTGGYVLEVSAGSRSITFGGRDRATYTDADGSVVVVSLKGPGTGTIFFEDDTPNANATRIVLEGTTDRTTLSIKGDTAIGAFNVNGSAKSIGSKSVDLTGDFTATGVVKSLTFRNVSGSAITVGNGTLAFAAANVLDSSLSTIGLIKSLKVDSWSDTGGPADVISAGTISSLSSRDGFSADIRADSIGKMSVGGVLGGDVRSSGNIASLAVGVIGPVVVAAGVATSSTGAPALLTDFINPAASLRSFAVRSRSAGSFAAGATVAAPTISKASIGQTSTSNGGVPFGLVADVVGSVSGSTDDDGRFRVRRSSAPATAFSSGDFLVKIL